MREGWLGDEYLILFDEPEVCSATERYAIDEFLPGYQVLGLRGWDDFLVRDPAGSVFKVPTVPLIPQHLERFFIPDKVELRGDEQLRGRIKWYVKPIVFAGDPNDHRNLTWLTHEQHASLVKWWNDLYRSTTGHPS